MNEEYLPQVNKAKIEDLKEDIHGNKAILKEIKENFTNHKFSTDTKLNEVSKEINNLHTTLNSIDERLSLFKSEMPWSLNLGKLFTKENIAIATAIVLLGNVLLSTFKGEDAKVQIDQLMEILEDK